MKNNTVILIVSCIFALYILIALSFILKINQKLNPKEKLYELFTYDYDQLCQAPFEYNNQSYKTCTKNVFNGFQTIILDWPNNKKKNNYICYYFYLATNYLTDDENLYYNTNYWLTIYDKNIKETVGTARWSNCYKNKSRKVFNKFKTGKANVPFVKSYITATSGILEKFQNANIIVDFTEDVRKIHIYTDGSYTDKKYEKYKKENLLEKKLQN